MKRYELVVVGAGAGGLVVAIGYAKAGKKVLLIEKGAYGGDCTNYGCIPSKSLIASAALAHSGKEASSYGIEWENASFKAEGALKRVRSIIERVRHHEEPEALNQLGVETLNGEAFFTDPHTLQVEGTQIFGEKIVLACGSSPSIPPIEGLEDMPFLTNETVFSLEKIPTSIAILGAGPIGCELAQAFLRLGSNVFLIESERGLMPREEKEASELMASQFKKEGMQLFVRCEMSAVHFADGQFTVCVKDSEGKEIDLQAESFLISTGRKPNTEGLKLENAGIDYSEKGIAVNAYGKTNQKHIYAIGDVTGSPFFTHLAEHHGRAVLTSLLLPFRKKILTQDVPRVTFTDPEIASIGLSENEAIEKYGKNKLAIYFVPFPTLDRAICAGREEGFVKIVTKRLSSRILGATIACERAGEMLQELSLAMQHNIPLRKLANLIHPYPIYSAAIRKAADLWLTQTILPLFRGKK